MVLARWALAALLGLTGSSLALAAGALWQVRRAETRVAALTLEMERLEQRLEASASGAPADRAVRDDPGGADPFMEQLVRMLEADPEDAAELAPPGPSAAAPPERRGRGRFADMMRVLEGDREARLQAARQLRHAPGPGRLLSARTLLELEPEEGIELVQELVDAAGPDRRSQRVASGAIQMLAEVDSPEVDRLLYDYYEGESALLTRVAARALETRGDSAPMTRLVTSMSAQLSSPDGGVRIRTAQELGRTRSPVATPSLLALLADSNSEVRLRAAEALGRTGDASAIAALTPLLDDPIAGVRDSAQRSLDDLRNPQPERERFGFRFLRGFGGGAP